MGPRVKTLAPSCLDLTSLGFDTARQAVRTVVLLEVVNKSQRRTFGHKRGATQESPKDVTVSVE